jgi:hypothetical protein
VMATWTRIKADHFFHASCYVQVARMLAPKLVRPPRVIQGAAKTQMPSGTNYRAPNTTPRIGRLTE